MINPEPSYNRPVSKESLAISRQALDEAERERADAYEDAASKGLDEKDARIAELEQQCDDMSYDVETSHGKDKEIKSLRGQLSSALSKIKSTGLAEKASKECDGCVACGENGDSVDGCKCCFWRESNRDDQIASLNNMLDASKTTIAQLENLTSQLPAYSDLTDENGEPVRFVPGRGECWCFTEGRVSECQSIVFTKNGWAGVTKRLPLKRVCRFFSSQQAALDAIKAEGGGEG